jgi:hypothetical protein
LRRSFSNADAKGIWRAFRSLFASVFERMIFFEQFAAKNFWRFLRALEIFRQQILEIKIEENGRSDRIRTCDVLLPKQVL